jgi:acyl-coenzyme A synthetase/AMP-(fatty) acid ligase
VREELHRILKEAFHVPAIHSEYGMTELLSQAWSTGVGRYRCPPWMQVRIRDVNDPFTHLPAGRTGGIDVIDLANIASCPFISTQDLGRMHPDGSFEVLGRFDHSQVRGCNLMVE